MASKRRVGAKGAALTVAAGLITWGVQQAATSDPLAGGIVAVIGLLVMVGYQVVEETDHEQPYNDFVEQIGEDTLRELGQLSAEEIRQLRFEIRSEE